MDFHFYDSKFKLISKFFRNVLFLCYSEERRKYLEMQRVKFHEEMKKKNAERERKAKTIKKMHDNNLTETLVGLSDHREMIYSRHLELDRQKNQEKVKSKAKEKFFFILFPFFIYFCIHLN